MASLKFKKCCCCLDLRLGTNIIAYVCLVLEVIALGIASYFANFIRMSSKNDFSQIYVIRFLIFLFMLIMVLKIVLCIGLLIGLTKKLPDQLETWYKGYLLSIFVEVAVMMCIVVYNFDVSNVWSWVAVAVRVIAILVNIYIILIVRSYYFQMSKESNYYRNIAYTHNPYNTGEAIYTEIPINPDTESLYKKSKDKEDQYEVSKKNGGVVYSTHPSNIPLPAAVPPCQGKEKQNTLYPSLV